MFRSAVLSLALVATMWVGAFAAPSTPAPRAASPDAITEYRLGAADKVRITVYGEPTLTGEYSVTSGGFISFPLIGEVNATNRTLAEVQKEISIKLADGFIKDPSVSAEVLTFRPYYVLGEVNRPGLYPYSSGLTVLKAVATAGGFTYRANQKRVFITRGDKPEEHEYKLAQETLVAPGDTIRITERHF
jgi:protein involved in polysaccharide export with SLBB domain